MRIYTETCKLSHDDLRVISQKSGDSVKTLKRMKKSYYYLGYNSANGLFRFLPESVYLSEYSEQSPNRFFELIEQESLLGLLK